MSSGFSWKFSQYSSFKDKVCAILPQINFARQAQEAGLGVWAEYLFHPHPSIWEAPEGLVNFKVSFLIENADSIILDY
ncbi:MAG: hypothetical protein Fur0022_23000 [Anaerolineales bacterium]